MKDTGPLWKRIERLGQIELEPAIRTFFTELADLQADSELDGFLSDILARRPGLMEQHFAYLLWAAFEYVTDFAYSGWLSRADTLPILTDFLEHREELLRLCLNRHLSATFPARYAALQMMLALLQRGSHGVERVVDLGCSLGLGLRALNTSLLRALRPADPELLSLLDTTVPIQHLIGVDLLDTHALDWKWIRACDSPDEPEVVGFDSLRAAYKWLLQHGTPMRYVRADLLDGGRLLQSIEPHSVDVIWTSNVLFEVAETPATGVVRLAPIVGMLLRPSGWWINADYGGWDMNFGTSQNPYLVIARKAANFSKDFIVMVSTNDVFVDLEIGPDFQAFRQEIESECTGRGRGGK